MMKTTLEIPDTIFRRAKSAAANRGIPLREFVTEAVRALASHGPSARLRALAQGIATHAQRRRAFRLALKVAHSKGKPSAAVARVLNLLQATFGLADDEVQTLRLESA